MAIVMLESKTFKTQGGIRPWTRFLLLTYLSNYQSVCGQWVAGLMSKARKEGATCLILQFSCSR